MSASGARTLQPLERALGHTFRDGGLLELALTHRSAAREHNERLEFLGDAVLGMVAAELLYSRFDRLREGPLTRARAALVKRETLAAIARELSLGVHLRLGGGELKSGGRSRDSTLADAFEALIGAVHLDGGIDAARRVVGRFLMPRLEGLESGVHKDSKTRLQEFLQARGFALPDYEVSKVSGRDHEQTFTVVCAIEAARVRVCGAGRSRRIAEQQAAAAALAELRERA